MTEVDGLSVSRELGGVLLIPPLAVKSPPSGQLPFPKTPESVVVDAGSSFFKHPVPTSSFQKYYAVRRGRNPGIYLSWTDCKLQVHGFAHARYKSFLSLREAEGFLQGSY